MNYSLQFIGQNSLSTHNNVYIGCESFKQILCAYRKNNKEAKIVTILKNKTIHIFDKADDPRVFNFQGETYATNNYLFNFSIIKIPYGPFYKLPFSRIKNLVPIPTKKQIILLDIQKRQLHYFKLLNNTINSVSKKTIHVHRVKQRCQLPPTCFERGGTNGLYYNKTSFFGIRRCTSANYTKKRNVYHHAFIWKLVIPNLYIYPICELNKNALVDPNALYEFKKNTWIFATTESEMEWNRYPAQKYYNNIYKIIIDR